MKQRKNTGRLLPVNQCRSWKQLNTGVLCTEYKPRLCMVKHIAGVWSNRVRLPILIVVSWTGKKNKTLFAFVVGNSVSRDRFGSPVRRQLAHLQTQAESGAYLRDSSRVPRRRPVIILNHHTPSAQSRVYRVMHFIAYRWRSLPRVRRHRASRPQGSSERVLPWQVTMDQ